MAPPRPTTGPFSVDSLLGPPPKPSKVKVKAKVKAKEKKPYPNPTSIDRDPPTPSKPKLPPKFRRPAGPLDDVPSLPPGPPLKEPDRLAIAAFNALRKQEKAREELIIKARQRKTFTDEIIRDVAAKNGLTFGLGMGLGQVGVARHKNTFAPDLTARVALARARQETASQGGLLTPEQQNAHDMALIDVATSRKRSFRDRHQLPSTLVHGFPSTRVIPESTPEKPKPTMTPGEAAAGVQREVDLGDKRQHPGWFMSDEAPGTYGQRGEGVGNLGLTDAAGDAFAGVSDLVGKGYDATPAGKMLAAIGDAADLARPPLHAAADAFADSMRTSGARTSRGWIGKAIDAGNRPLVGPGYDVDWSNVAQKGVEGIDRGMGGLTKMATEGAGIGYEGDPFTAAASLATGHGIPAGYKRHMRKAGKEGVGGLFPGAMEAASTVSRVGLSHPKGLMVPVDAIIGGLDRLVHTKGLEGSGQALAANGVPVEMAAALGFTPEYTAILHKQALERGWYEGELRGLVGMDLLEHSYTSPPAMALRIAANAGRGAAQTGAFMTGVAALATGGPKAWGEFGGALKEEGAGWLNNPLQAAISDPISVIPGVGAAGKTAGMIGHYTQRGVTMPMREIATGMYRSGEHGIARELPDIEGVAQAGPTAPEIILGRGQYSKNLWTQSGEKASDWMTRKGYRMPSAFARQMDRIVRSSVNQHAHGHTVHQVAYRTALRDLAGHLSGKKKRAETLLMYLHHGGTPEEMLDHYEHVLAKAKEEGKEAPAAEAMARFLTETVIPDIKNLSEADQAFIDAARNISKHTSESHIEMGRFRRAAMLHRSMEMLLTAQQSKAARLADPSELTPKMEAALHIEKLREMVLNPEKPWAPLDSARVAPRRGKIKEATRQEEKSWKQHEEQLAKLEAEGPGPRPVDEGAAPHAEAEKAHRAARPKKEKEPSTEWLVEQRTAGDWGDDGEAGTWDAVSPDGSISENFKTAAAARAFVAQKTEVPHGYVISKPPQGRGFNLHHSADPENAATGSDLVGHFTTRKAAVAAAHEHAKPPRTVRPGGKAPVKKRTETIEGKVFKTKQGADNDGKRRLAAARAEHPDYGPRAMFTVRTGEEGAWSTRLVIDHPAQPGVRAPALDTERALFRARDAAWVKKHPKPTGSAKKLAAWEKARREAVPRPLTAHARAVMEHEAKRPVRDPAELEAHAKAVKSWERKKRTHERKIAEIKGKMEAHGQTAAAAGKRRRNLTDAELEQFRKVGDTEAIYREYEAALEEFMQMHLDDGGIEPARVEYSRQPLRSATRKVFRSGAPLNPKSSARTSPPVYRSTGSSARSGGFLVDAGSPIRESVHAQRLRVGLGTHKLMVEQLAERVPAGTEIGKDQVAVSVKNFNNLTTAEHRFNPDDEISHQANYEAERTVRAKLHTDLQALAKRGGTDKKHGTGDFTTADESYLIPKAAWERMLEWSQPVSKAKYQKVMREYQRVLISTFPGTVIGNTLGSMPLAFASGAGAPSVKRALHTMKRGGANRDMAPHSLYGAGPGGHLEVDAHNPITFGMKKMRGASIYGEDLSRIAAYWHKALPYVRQEGNRLKREAEAANKKWHADKAERDAFIGPRPSEPKAAAEWTKLNDHNMKMAKEIPDVPPAVLSAEEAFEKAARMFASGKLDNRVMDEVLDHVERFMGDTNKPLRGGALQTLQSTQAILFLPWVLHMSKLVLFSMPIKHPRRMVFLNAVARYGDEYRQKHGAWPSWMVGFLPLFHQYSKVPGLENLPGGQEMQKWSHVFTLMQLNPQATAGGVMESLTRADKEWYERLAGVANPAIQAAVDSIKLTEANQGLPEDRRVDMWRAAANTGIGLIPGIRKAFPMMGLQADSLPWDPIPKQRTDPYTHQLLSPFLYPGARPDRGWQGFLERAFGFGGYWVPNEGPIQNQAMGERFLHSLEELDPGVAIRAGNRKRERQYLAPDVLKALEGP